MKALVLSGSYYTDCEICSVRKATSEEKEEYADWVQPLLHIQTDEIKEIEIKHKNVLVIENIRQNREADGKFGHEESQIFYISDEEAAEIIKQNNDVDKKAAEKETVKEITKTVEITAKIAEAKETGKPVMIDKYSTACHDLKEECSTDIVTVYAMPDGSEKTEVNHTW